MFANSVRKTCDKRLLNNQSSIRNTPDKPLDKRKSIGGTPIMGKIALLTKQVDNIKNIDDSEVVSKLVLGKYKNTLNRFHERSSMRTKSRRKFSDDRRSKSDPVQKCSTMLLNNTKNIEISYVIDAQENIEIFNITKMECKHHEQSTQNITDNADNVLIPEDGTVFDGFLQNVEENYAEDVEYDSGTFLKDALGELYNGPVTPSDRSASQTDLHQFNENNSSIRTSNISTLVSKGSSFYNDFTKMIYRRNTRTSSPTLDITEATHTYCQPEECKASMLVNEAAIQHQIIVQTSKAINFCLSSDEFHSSAEYIEAEKILLLALERRVAILKEFRVVEYEDVADDAHCLGEVELSNLVFSINENNQFTNDCTQWFVAIIGSGTSLFATDIVTLDKNSNIKFEKAFKFSDLSSHFEIKINLYSLSMKNNLKQHSHDSRFQLHRETTTCPAPTRFLNFSRTSSRDLRRHISYERRHPSFLLCGTVLVHISDINKQASIPISQTSNCIKLKPTLSLNMACNIQFTGEYFGFLTIGTETGKSITWNREWCFFQGFVLKYWNYPSQQEFVEPIGIIDISYCIASSITQADRTLCARARTLLLELEYMCKKTNTHSIRNYYLSADNLEEMDDWKRRLNFALNSLRNWKQMSINL